MRILNSIAGSCLLAVVLFSGCVSTGPAGKSDPDKGKTVQSYMDRAAAFEKQGDCVSALEQYTLVLTLDPAHTLAAEKKRELDKEVRNRSEAHFQAGLKLDGEGQTERARKQYLAALQNWPDHEGAKERVTWGRVQETDAFIVHTIEPGDSVSKLAKIYYGNVKKYPVISHYNQMKDATQTRIGQTLRVPAIDGITLMDLQAAQKRYLEARASGDAGAVEAIIGTLGEGPVDQPSATTAAVKTDGGAPQDQAGEKPAKPVFQPVDTGSGGNVEVVVPEPPPESGKGNVPGATTPATTDFQAALPVSSPGAKKPPVLDEEVPDYLGHGRELLAQKKYAEAIVELQKAVEADPGSKDGKAELYEAYFQLGLIQFGRQEYLDARKQFENALHHNSDCDKCSDYIHTCSETYMEKHYQLGIEYFGKEQLDKAIREWKLVEAIDPGYKDLGVNLKKALLLSERLEKIKKGQKP